MMGRSGPATGTKVKDFTVSCSTDAVIIALLRRLRAPGSRVPGAHPVVLTAAELARAEQVHLDRRADGHNLELRVVDDT